MPSDTDRIREKMDGATDRFHPVKHDMTQKAGVDWDWGTSRFGRDIALTLSLENHDIDEVGIGALLKLALHAKNSDHSLRVICRHRFTYTTLRTAGLCDVAELSLAGEPF